MIDSILSNGTADPADDFEAVMVPSGNALVGVADRAGYPVLTVPAGYGTGSAGRNPIGVTFVGGPLSEATLLADGYAYEQATNVRLAPSWTNPSMWRCVAGSTFYSPHECNPGDALAPVPAADVIAGDVSGTVPATLSLTLGGPVALGPFKPGVGTTYTATTTANVISTAGDAALTVADPGASPGHLVNGAFSLAAPLQVSAASPAGTSAGLGALGAGPLALLSYAGPVTNDPVTLTFAQAIGGNEPLRTGSYSKTLTYTLSTTQP